MKNTKEFGTIKTLVHTITIFKNHSNWIFTKHFVVVNEPQRLHFGIHVFTLFNTEIKQGEN